MKVPQRTFALVALAVAACSPNLLEEARPDYRYLAGFLCQPDGSLILAQKANSSGEFTDPRPTETVQNCTIDGDPEWDILDQIKANEPRDYRWLGIPLDVALDVTPARPR